MRKSTALLLFLGLSLLFHLQATAQQNNGRTAITSSAPDLLTLRSKVDTGNYGYITLQGTGLDKLAGVRVVRGSKAQPGWAIDRIRVAPLQRTKDAEKTHLSDTVMAVYKVRPTMKPEPGQYELQLSIEGKWVDVACQIQVKAPRLNKPLAVKPKLPGGVSSAKMPGSITTKRDDEFSDNILQATIKRPIQERFEEEIEKKMMDESFSTVEVLDYYPKEMGQVDGTIVIIGSKLDSIKSLKIGNTVLSKRPMKKLSIGGKQKYVYFTGYQPLTGSLKIVKPIRTGKVIANVEQVLEANYRLVDRSAMVPVLKIEQVRASVTGDSVIYPFQRFRIRVRIDHVPGNYITDSELRMVINNKFVPIGGLNIVYDETFLDSNYIFYGNTLYMSFTDRAFAESAYTTTLTLVTHDLNKTGFGRSRQFPIRFPLGAPVPYVINDTYSLKSKLNFRKCYSWGATSGMSYGSPFTEEDDISVGLLERDNDLTFRITSGPLGSQAVWVSQPVLLKDGWSLESITFDVNRVSPDNSIKTHVPGGGENNLLYLLQVPDAVEVRTSGSSGNTLVIGPLFDLNRTVTVPYYAAADKFTGDLMFSVDPNVIDCEGSFYNNLELWSGAGRGVFIRPMVVDLEAESTLLNDHRITFTLKKLVLKGPPGQDVESAMSSDYFGLPEWWIVKDCRGQDINPVRFHRQE